MALDDPPKPFSNRNRVELESLSKSWLVKFIEENIDEQEKLLEVSDDDKERVKGLEIRIFGQESSVFDEGELGALLCKFVPEHLLNEHQTIKAVAFFDDIMVPQVDEDGYFLNEISVDLEKMEDRALRTLCLIRNNQPLMNVFSLRGLSEDPRVLKIIALNAIIHDLAHGVINWYIEQAGEGDDDDGGRDYIDWIVELGNIYGSVAAISQKSSAYLLDHQAISEAETDDERAFLQFERAQEDFCEAFRLKALYPQEYESKTEGENKPRRDFLDKVWST